MTNRAIIEITSINLGGASKTSSVVSVKSAQCINKEATSAKLRCSLSSNLINLKSVSNINLNFNGINFVGINSEIKLNFNTDYLLQQSNGNTGKLLLLDYQGTWYMSENIIDSNVFASEKVPNTNMLDTIIPPSSCFDMKMTETLEKYRVSFSAIAKVAVYSSSGDRYVGSQLTDIKNVIKSDAQVFGDKLIQIPIIGDLDISVIGADHSDIAPC